MKIRNKKTGEIKEISDNELGKYGLTSPVQQKSPGEFLQSNAGAIGSTVGGFAAPYPLSAATTGVGAYTGKRIEQGRAPLPPSPGIMLATSLFNPKQYEELKKSEYSPEAYRQDIEGLKYAGGQAGIDLAAGWFGKQLGKLASKVKGPLAKIGIGTPKGVQNNISKVLTDVSKQMDEIVKQADEAGGLINNKKIIDNLDDLIKQYGPEGKDIPEAVNEVGKVKDWILRQGDVLPSKEMALKQGAGEIVFGESGKEAGKRGGAMWNKRAQKIAGGGLKENLLEAMPDQASKDALEELFKKYGSLAKTSQALNQPFKGGFTTAGLAGISSLLGFPQLGAPLALAAVAKMPYTNFLGKKAVGAGLDVAGKSLSPLAKLLMTALQQEQSQVQVPEDLPYKK